MIWQLSSFCFDLLIQVYFVCLVYVSVLSERLHPSLLAISLDEEF